MAILDTWCKSQQVSVNLFWSEDGSCRYPWPDWTSDEREVGKSSTKKSSELMLRKELK